MRRGVGLLLAGLPLPALAADSGSTGWLLVGFFLPLALYLALQLLNEQLSGTPEAQPRLVLLSWAVSGCGAATAGWHGGRMVHGAVLAAYPAIDSPVPQMVALTAGAVSGLAIAGMVFALGYWLLQQWLQRR